MKLPPKSSNRYKVLEIIYKHGPMKAADVAYRLPRMGNEAARCAVGGCMDMGYLTRNVYTYDLVDSVRHYFDGCEMDREDRKPQIVPPRQVNVWTPEMRGYEANLRRHWRAA